MPPPVQLQATAAKLIDLNSTGGLVTYNALTAVVSGPEANITAGALNMVMQWLKQFPRFNQNLWAVPVLVALGLVVAAALWHDELRKVLLGGLNISAQAWQNYAALREGPIMPPAAAIVSHQPTTIEKG